MELLEIRHLSHIILYGQHETTHFLYVAFATDVSVSSVGVSYLGALCSDCIRDILSSRAAQNKYKKVLYRSARAWRTDTETGR
jgi:hypothetical protein